jgi:hypothetical protein
MILHELPRPIVDVLAPSKLGLQKRKLEAMLGLRFTQKRSGPKRRGSSGADGRGIHRAITLHLHQPG